MFNPSAGRPRASDTEASYGYSDQAWPKFGINNTSTASSIQSAQPTHVSGRNFEDSSGMDWTPSLSDLQPSFDQQIDTSANDVDAHGSLQGGGGGGVGRLIAQFENKGFAPPLPPRPSNAASNSMNTNHQVPSPFGNFNVNSPNVASPLASPTEVSYAPLGNPSRVASPIASPPPMNYGGFQGFHQVSSPVSSGPFGSMDSFMVNNRPNNSMDMGISSPMMTSSMNSTPMNSTPMNSTPMVNTHMSASMNAPAMTTPNITSPSTTTAGVPGTPGFAIWRPPVPDTPKPTVSQPQTGSIAVNTSGQFAKPPVPSTPKPVMNAGSQLILDFNTNPSVRGKAPARAVSRQPARQPARRPSRQHISMPTPVFSPSPTPKQELKQEPQTPQLSQISPAPPAERRPSVSLRPQTGTRPSREQVPAEAWESFKSTIKTLYLEERKPLKEVMSIMADKYNFQATPKMYKTRFSQWGFVKNNTEEEVKRLLSMKFQRDAEGKVSEFVRNGKVVNLGTYLKRKGVTEYDLIDFEQPADLPAHIKCRTPTPPPATGYLQSPDLLRAQETVIGNIRKAFLQCRQSEVETETQIGWQTIMVWGAGSSELLMEANHYFEQRDPDQGGHYLMLAFKQLEFDLKKLSPQGIKELLLGMVHRDPGMMTALCKYLAAYSTTNFERSHPLRQIFTCLYEVQQKHGSATLSDLLWGSIPMIAEELEAIYGRRHPYVARTWIDLAMFYNHVNSERLEKLVTELRLLQRQMEHRLGTDNVDVLVLRYAICQLMYSANPNSDNTKQAAMDLWNHIRSMGYVYPVRDSRPNVYCYHSPVKVSPYVKRCRRRYELGLRFMEDHAGVRILPYFEEDFHTTEHAEDHIPQQIHHHHIPQQTHHHHQHHPSQYAPQHSSQQHMSQQMSQPAPSPQDAWAAAMGLQTGPRWGGFI